MTKYGLLILRLVLGSLLVGHGAQKLFGVFHGPGIKGTSQMMSSLGFRPAKPWAYSAGISEYMGGLLVLLGFLNPLGPLSVVASMLMATTKVHWGKPIWVSKGGAELPLTNLAIATALILAGPGDLSIDKKFGINLPRWLALPGLLATTIIVGVATMKPDIIEDIKAKTTEQAEELQQIAAEGSEQNNEEATISA